MEFDITLSTGTIQYILRVRLIEHGQGYEHYKVTPKNNPDKYLVIQNNRPLIRKKLKLKYKPLTWTIKEGTINNNRNFNQLIKKIEQVLDPPPPSKKKTESYIKNVSSSRKQKPQKGSTIGDRKKQNPG